MPRSGHEAVTIGTDVYEQTKKAIEEINTSAGMKRFRSISHFVEEAIVNYAVGSIKRDSESPDEIIRKIIEIVWVEKICFDRSSLSCLSYLSKKPVRN